VRYRYGKPLANGKPEVELTKRARAETDKPNLKPDINGKRKNGTTT